MANEYLKRTPTSTGNTKVFTISIWSKLNDNSVANTPCDTFTNGSNFLTIRMGNPGVQGALVYQIDSATDYSRYWEIAERDFSGWSHHLFSFNSTSSSASERVCYYLNGIKISNYVDTYGTFPQNFDFKIDTTRSFDIFKNGDQNLYGEGEIFDYFFVDGQALTPDIFGYYKKGDGYISAGSTQATDFKRGQWVPKAPKVIKSVINARGGFGVNGFYLPMNDDSNFGADFHCEPSSIIKLKGEEDPQPRNGAPTTTDAYVSQLRTDPYAANLVLAVPGNKINLVTNGDFSQGTTGWTAYNSVISSTNGLQLEVNDSAAAGSWSAAVQEISTVIGQSYTLSLYVGTGSDSRIVGIYNGAYPAAGTAPSTTVGTYNSAQTVTHTFTATALITSIMLVMNNEGIGYFDDVVLYSNTPRDYSADIKGSGANKTLTADGNAGIADIPSYYGSAMTFPGTYNHNIALGANTDFAFGTGDFTVELWFNTNITDRQRILSSTQGGFIGSSWVLRLEPGNILTHYGANTITGVYAAPNQWHHAAVVREGTITSLFLNGVCCGVDTNDTRNYTEAGSNNFWLSSGYTVVPATENFDGEIQDLRIYKGVAKYKGGFDVPKPYTPVGIGTWRAVPDTTANNFATLNPLDAVTSNQSGTDYTQATHSNGNLTVILSDDFSSARGSIGVSSGKYYWEVRLDANTNSPGLGVIAPGNQLTSYSAGGGGASYEPRGDRFRKNGVGHYDGTDNKTDDGLIVGVALDKDAGSISFYADGALLSNGTMTGLNDLSDVHIPECFTFNDGPSVDNTYTWNFGQNPTFSGQTTAGTYTDSNGKGLFKYEPPSGFLALCEDNLPTPAIKNPGEHFKTVLYTGDGNKGRSITGVGFQPDFVWIKVRTNGTYYHELYDSVRMSPVFFSNATDAEITINTLNSFDNDGFTVSLQSGYNGTNQSGQNYVAWCWKAGGAAVENTDGSITSQVSANQDAGFSIVSYTGTGSTGSIGHGLGKTPAFVITKHRNLDTHWRIWHKGLSGYNYTLFFNTGAEQVQPAYSALPTDSVINLASDLTGSYNFVTYCWAEIEGFSKFGSYIGNESVDGPFVYCGFKPALIIWKNASANGNWVMSDSSRDSVNPAFGYQVAESPALEERGTAIFDFLSNGFKIRNSWTSFNGSGNTIIFAAFAESPFTTANAK